MISKLKAIGWGVVSCALPLCSILQAYDYDYFEMSDVVQPTYVWGCDQCLSPCEGWNAPFRGSLSHTEGKWYDVEDGYTSLKAFSGLELGDLGHVGHLGYHGEFIPFIDLRGHVFNNGIWAGNFGVGFRGVVEGSENIIGMNVFYDYRKSKRRHNFNQIGFGFEILNPCIDFRLNFYFPIGNIKDKTDVHIYNNYIGPYWALCRDNRRALSGGDLELGYWVVPRAQCQFVNLYGAVAPYYYASRRRHSGNSNGVYGVTGRLMTLLGEYFSFELRAGYDRDYKGMVQGVLTFQVPLDRFCRWEAWWDSLCGGCCRDDCRVYQPVVRQEMIVLSPKNCCWESNF
jgi:hypothetical protein